MVQESQLKPTKELDLTLLGLKARGFLRHFCLNIPITRVPRLLTFAQLSVRISFERLGANARFRESPRVPNSKLDR